VQVGLSSEPLLENTIHKLDLSIREMAYIIFKSKFVLTLEGLYNHLASCFDKKLSLYYLACYQRKLVIIKIM